MNRLLAEPLRPRAALVLATARVRIGSVEAALAQRLQREGLVQAVTEGWQVKAPADEALEAIARWLANNGLAGRWRNELLDVTDEQGNAVAAIERAAVRPLGIKTFAVHLIGVRRDGAVWVQQRALDKATDPGLWDTTMGGQIGAGETVVQALERETWEEAGLRLVQLSGVAFFERFEIRRPVVEGYMIEQIDVYAAQLPDAAVPVNRDGEVQRFDCLPPAELSARLAAHSFTFEAAAILSAWLAQGAIK